MNSTTDWFLVVIQLETCLDWTFHSATWVLDRLKRLEIVIKGLDQFNCWLHVPSSDSTGIIPWLDAYTTDSTERLECKTGSTVLKFNDSTTKTWSKEIQFQFHRWILALTADKGSSFSSSLSDLSLRPAQTSWNSMQPPTWYLLSRVALPLQMDLEWTFCHCFHCFHSATSM